MEITLLQFESGGSKTLDLLPPIDSDDKNINKDYNHKLYQIIFKNKFLKNLIFSFIKSHNLLLKKNLLYKTSTRINIFKFNQLSSNWICNNGYFNLFIDKIKNDSEKLIQNKNNKHIANNNSNRCNLLSNPIMIVTFKSLYLFSRYCKDFEYFKFIYFQFKDMIDSNYRVFDECCFNGSIKIIEFLSERGVGCSIEAIDNAARTGRLDVVKYLHKNGKQCSVNAVDLAAKNGHLEVVRFLLENRSEGCSDKSLLYATQENHIDIVRYLLKFKKPECDCLFLDQNGLKSTISYEILNIFTKEYGYSISFLGDEITNYCNQEHPDFDSIKIISLESIKDSRLKSSNNNKNYNNFLRSITRAIIQCSKWNHQEIFKFLLGYSLSNLQLNSYIISQCLDNAAVFGHLDMFKLIESHFPNSFCTRLAMDQNNNVLGQDLYRYTKEFHKKQIKIIKYLHSKNRNYGCTTACMDEAAKYGNFKLLKWLNENRQEGGSQKAFDNTILHGNYSILDYLLENRKEGFSKSIIEQLLRENKPERVKFLLEKKYSQPNPIYISYAVPQSISFFNYLLENTNGKFTGSAYINCAKFGDIEKFKILINLSKQDPSLPIPPSGVVTILARNGDLEFLQYIYESNIFKSFDPNEKFIDYAACFSLECVKYLHSKHPQLSDQCSYSAIENATTYGHYNIIEFLLKNRCEGFKESTLLISIKNGHFEIFKLLFQHPISRTICPLHFANLACEYNHIEIIKYLEILNEPLLFTPGSFDGAIRGGNLALLYYFKDKRSDQPSALGFLNALNGINGNISIPIIQFLIKYYLDYCTLSLIDDFQSSFLTKIKNDLG